MPATVGHVRNPSAPPRHRRRDCRCLSFALRYQGRKRVHHADDVMARITAERLVQHAEGSGFVLMKEPPRGAPTTAPVPPSRGSDGG